MSTPQEISNVIKLQIENYKESVEFTNEYIGNDIINKMKRGKLKKVLGK